MAVTTAGAVYAIGEAANPTIDGLGLAETTATVNRTTAIYFKI